MENNHLWFSKLPLAGRGETHTTHRRLGTSATTASEAGNLVSGFLQCMWLGTCDRPTTTAPSLKGPRAINRCTGICVFPTQPPKKSNALLPEYVQEQNLLHTLTRSSLTPHSISLRLLVSIEDYEVRDSSSHTPSSIPCSAGTPTTFSQGAHSGTLAVFCTAAPTPPWCNQAKQVKIWPSVGLYYIVRAQCCILCTHKQPKNFQLWWGHRSIKKIIASSNSYHKGQWASITWW